MRQECEIKGERELGERSADPYPGGVIYMMKKERRSQREGEHGGKDGESGE